MGPRFTIDIDWELLDQGSVECRATFGAIGLRVGDALLTEASDLLVGKVRRQVHLSGYLLAEWLAWNWWRLSYEPRRSSPPWKFSHRLASIGGGYIWPNVELDSDGERVQIRAHPTKARPSEPLRYITDASVEIPLGELHIGIELFIGRILEKLRSDGISGTNLEHVWGAVAKERSAPDDAFYRRIEAAMGYDPDEADGSAVRSLIADVDALGRGSVIELATGATVGEPAPTASKLKDLAVAVGHDTRLSDIPRLPETALESIRQPGPAWVSGETAAQIVREQEKLGDGALTDEQLAHLAGTHVSTLGGNVVDAPFSFALRNGAEVARLVLQSPIHASRRFALARWIGDSLLEKRHEPLVPLLRTRSFRQKRQRAFAAELLCPFRNASRELDAECSEESQERVANKYGVSPMLVRTQLVNHRLLDPDALEEF